MKLFNTIALSTLLIASSTTHAMENKTIRIATFNVSMEALNYAPKGERGAVIPTGNELKSALSANHQQIKNIAEIIQHINPDIILLNEFDRIDDNGVTLNTFIRNYLNKPQQNTNAIDYPYMYQGKVNTGVLTKHDLNQDGTISRPADTHGFGYFAGHFGMALLSKYPINDNKIRTFQHFKWKDMPNALKPTNADGSDYYSAQAWQALRLSSKSHWDIPVTINNETVHVLASHPTPPVFDGPEDRNGKRNHDEIRFWIDYITPDKGLYIYDDRQHKGGLDSNQRFILLGDLNASEDNGDAVKSGISALIHHPSIIDVKPKSLGAKAHKKDDQHGQYHTAHWGMRADYVLPSTNGWEVIDSGVFWPEANSKQYRLIENRAASSDHRLVWIDLKIK